jgi:aspartyl aminopeptidase
MHSIREMMGAEDVRTGVLHFTAVLDHHPSVVKGLESIKN